MNKMPFFAVKHLNGEYLQGVDVNERYSRTGRAPTMGVRHSYNEFKTIWGETPKAFDYMTLGGYLKVLLSEFHWEDRECEKFEVIPRDQNGGEYRK